jgi:hypothetical protein
MYARIVLDDLHAIALDAKGTDSHNNLENHSNSLISLYSFVKIQCNNVDKNFLTLNAEW